ncbi:hypothetical protein BH09PSE4_BH09PSE4_11480 [soil metagenome]
MRNAGQTNLGDVVRSIPQSFGGGQNAGIGLNVPATSGVNVGGASTINLRGLGSDATLTLLNGHRLTYNGSRQGVDISAIPLGAVERLEIVADGASALYGSDAVAGVANIILKRDYKGLETSARLGGATDGGDFQQQYGAVAGTRWSSGGVIAAYEYAINTAIWSNDRSYAVSRPNVTIYPAQRRHAVTLSGHQALTDTLSLEIDALYNKRWHEIDYPANFAGDLNLSRGVTASTSESYAVAPALKLALHDWRLSLSGVWGQETVFTEGTTFAGAVQTGYNFNCYCNNGKSAELGADGPVFRLPGGMAKVAVGAGYRYNLLVAFRGVGSPNNIRASQDSYYAYGELNLPLVGPDTGIPLIHSLNVSGALRYERYPGVAEITTPKLGLIFAPTPDFEVKGSWGKSFRAPTLFQLYQLRAVTLTNITAVGGTGFPAGSTALLLSGGNATLKPERATSWAATIDLHPRALPGARLQVSYFSTDYEDRIVTPISFTSQSLSNPIYAGLVTYTPSDAAKAAVIASAGQFTLASTVGTYIPARVVAIVDNSNLNVGRQTIHGVDMLGDYQVDLGASGDRLTLSLNASYLESDQQLSSGQPVLQKAGLLFNPPHWRGRGSLGWSHRAMTLTGTLSRIGGVDDTRTASTIRIGGVTTLDLTARYRPIDAPGIWHGLDLTLSVRNALNEKPDTIATSVFYDSAFDSTNYSPVGRFISFGITKSW